VELAKAELPLGPAVILAEASALYNLGNGGRDRWQQFLVWERPAVALRRARRRPARFRWPRSSAGAGALQQGDLARAEKAGDSAS